MSEKSYPDSPGFKEVGGTSEEAAKCVEPSAGILRGKCLRALRGVPGGLTADQCAAEVGVTIMAMRPRLTELKLEGLIRKTNRRGKNASGHSAVIWEAV